MVNIEIWEQEKMETSRYGNMETRECGNKGIWKYLFLYFYISMFLWSHYSIHAAEIDFDSFPYIDWSEPHRVEEVKINFVYDGDTAIDSRGRRIRFLGVDAPELANEEIGTYEDEPGGQEAKRFSEEKILGEKILLVVPNATSRDHLGRTLGLIFYYDDRGRQRCLNWELLRNGLADALVMSDNEMCIMKDWSSISDMAKMRNEKHCLKLAEMTCEEGFDEDAVEIFKKAIKKYPNYMELYEGLGTLYSSLKQYELEMDIYLAALEKKPSNRIKMKLARCYENLAKTSGPLSLVNYKKKAIETWEGLVNTEFGKLAKERLASLTR